MLDNLKIIPTNLESKVSTIVSFPPRTFTLYNHFNLIQPNLVFLMHYSFPKEQRYEKAKKECNPKWNYQCKILATFKPFIRSIQYATRS